MLATVEYDKGRLLEKSDGQNIDKSKTSQKLSDCFFTLCALRVDQIIVQLRKVDVRDGQIGEGCG